MAHVQGESLKVIAVDFARLLNSPATSPAGGRFNLRGVFRDGPAVQFLGRCPLKISNRLAADPGFAILLMVVRAARFLIREIAIGIIVRTAIRAKPDDPGILLFGVYRTPAGRWKTQLPADIIANEHLAHLFKPPN